MKTASDLLNLPSVSLELRQNSLAVLKNGEGIELPIDRDAHGRITEASRARVVSSVRELVRQQPWWPRLRAVCAIGGRGVSVRRLQLPPASQDETQRLMLLQIESQFPLAPDALAWGSMRVPGPGVISGEQAKPGNEFVVAALKREVIEEYSALLVDCGLTPVFALAGQARAALCPGTPPAYAILDLSVDYFELATFDHRTLSALRVMRGRANLVPTDPAEMEALAAWIKRSGAGPKLYITGVFPELNAIASALGRALVDIACEAVETPRAAGQTAATVGLRRQMDTGTIPLTIELRGAKRSETAARELPWKWMARAAALLVVCLGFRYAEALVFKPALARKVAKAKSAAQVLPQIDRQLGFFRYLETNQPAYLDTVYVFANASPPGTKIESLLINLRGDISLRASMQAAQASEFRSKLIDSGFFSSVLVDDQTPAANRQRVALRMSAQLRPASARPALTVKPVKDLPGSRGGEMPGMPMPGMPMPSMPMPMPSMPPGAAVRMSGAMPGAPAGSLPPSMSIPPPGAVPPNPPPP